MGVESWPCSPALQPSMVEKTMAALYPSARPCYTDARPSPSQSRYTDGARGCEVEPDAAADDAEEVEVVVLLLLLPVLPHVLHMQALLLSVPSGRISFRSAQWAL
ncbi:hypothetical protein A2U01_0063767 [Trifolium medium]|uniref:Uncharacterized protein n=1 Tax=Trifolium medium TaxID=97028 RepID=A0A392S3E5_9FABA|nr:hypothetical protein [Trifolium medium]